MTNISGEPLKKIVMETLPFLLAMIGALAFITLVPESILWLPRLFGYQGGAGLP
jgi:TRAP-type C4-dicarboxylate transport system permease large subunit